MTWTLFVGFFSTLYVLFSSMEGDIEFYMQPHSIIIVVGGTVAILLFSTPFGVLKSLFRSVWDVTRIDKSFSNYRKELINVSKTKKVAKGITHPLILYACDLWEQGVSPDLFVVLLSQKKNELVTGTADAVQCLKNLAKYPPALGMAGTVMGMIALFSNLDGQKEAIGGNLALAMTATFFGLIVANALISPLADRLHVKQVHEHRLINGIYEILLLVNQGEPDALISEEVQHRAG